MDNTILLYFILGFEIAQLFVMIRGVQSGRD
jgi:hypothetical protein